MVGSEDCINRQTSSTATELCPANLLDRATDVDNFLTAKRKPPELLCKTKSPQSLPYFWERVSFSVHRHLEHLERSGLTTGSRVPAWRGGRPWDRLTGKRKVARSSVRPE